MFLILITSRENEIQMVNGVENLGYVTETIDLSESCLSFRAADQCRSNCYEGDMNRTVLP